MLEHLAPYAARGYLCEVVEVPVSMRERSGGVPSARRFRLVFNFLRLLVGIAGGVLVGRRDGGRR